MFDETAAQQQAAYAGLAPMVNSSMQRVSYRKEIELAIERLEKELAKKKELLQLMNENPAIEKFMDLNRGY